MRTLDRIRGHASAAPGRAAYRAGNDVVTYGELWERAENLAALLRDLDARHTGRPSPGLPGPAPIALDGSRSPDTAVAMTACLIAGIPYVPVAPSTPPARLESMLRQSGARLLLAADGFPDPGIKGLTVIPLKDIGKSACPRAAAGKEDAACGTSRYAYIIFTSGTSGEPKGVPVYRDSLDNFTGWMSSYPPLDGYREITVLNQALFSFDLSVAGFFYPLACGHTVAAFRSEDELAAVLPETDAAVMTPSFLRMLLLDGDFRAERFPRLKCVWLCGEVLTPAAARQALNAFPDLTLINAYGPTEACCAVCAVRITGEDTEKPGPLPVGELSSAAAGIAVEDGEIVLRGKSVFGGYLDGSEGGHFREDGTDGYRTGDTGWSENGLLFCSGRKDRQVKYKGYRIELSDIEANISDLPGVTGCAAATRRRADGEISAIRAFVTVSDPRLTEAALKRRLAGSLPDYMIPKVIRIIDRMPVTENGKTDIKKLETL